MCSLWKTAVSWIWLTRQWVSSSSHVLVALSRSGCCSLSLSVVAQLLLTFVQFQSKLWPCAWRKTSTGAFKINKTKRSQKQQTPMKTLCWNGSAYFLIFSWNSAFPMNTLISGNSKNQPNLQKSQSTKPPENGSLESLGIIFVRVFLFSS